MRQWIEIFLFHLALRFLDWITAGHFPALVVTSGLIEENGRLLLVRRRDGRGLNFPGGYLTGREHPIGGAIREIWEETGYLADSDDLIGVYGRGTPGKGAGSILVLYRMHVVGGRARSSHEGDPVWLTPEEAFREKLDHATGYIIERYLARREQSQADERAP